MVPKTVCNIFRSDNKLSPWRNWGRKWTNFFTNRCSDWGWNFSLLSKPLEAKGAWQHIKVGLSGCWYLHIYTVWKRLPFQWHTQNDSFPHGLHADSPALSGPAWFYGATYGSAWPSAWNLVLSHLKISQSHKYSQIRLKTTPLSLSAQFYMKR